MHGPFGLKKDSDVFQHNHNVTLKTWNASNWILGLLSLNRFIMSLRFSGLLMYLVITVKLCLSSRSSPNSCRTETYTSLAKDSKEEAVVSYTALQNTHLQWLPLCHIVFRVQKLLIVLKDLETKGFEQHVRREDLGCFHAEPLWALKMNSEQLVSIFCAQVNTSNKLNWDRLGSTLRFTLLFAIHYIFPSRLAVDRSPAIRQGKLPIIHSSNGQRAREELQCEQNEDWGQHQNWSGPERKSTECPLSNELNMDAKRRVPFKSLVPLNKTVM